MIIPLTLLLGALGYFYYKSKDEVTLIEEDKSINPCLQNEDDDLYKDLEDLFI